MATNCEIKDIHPITGKTGNSLLHTRLKEKYPESVTDELSSYYVAIKTNPELLKNVKDGGFGDWTDPTNYEEMKKAAENSGVFNRQGEPQLFSHTVLGPYILNIAGKPIYLNDSRLRFSSAIVTQGAITLAGGFIADNEGLSLKNFVINRLTSRRDTLETQVNTSKEELRTAVSRARKRRLRSQIIEEFDILEKLNELLDNPTALTILEKRVDAIITRNNARVVADDNKGDLETNSDLINYILDANEISNRANDDIEIIRFFSTIPQFSEYAEDMEDQLRFKEENKYFGGVLYMNPSAARGLVEGIFADILEANPGQDMFDTYLEALRAVTVKSNHPQLNYMLDFLSTLDTNGKVKDPEAFKVKFFTAMYKANQNYIFTLIEKTKSSNEDGSVDISIKGDIIDPMRTSSKEGRIVNNLIETVLNGDKSKKELSAIKNDFGSRLNDIKTVEEIKEFLEELLLDELGLKLDDKTIPAFVESSYIYNNNSIKEVKALTEKFLTREARSEYISNENLTGELGVIVDLKDQKNKEQNANYKKALSGESTFLSKLSEVESLYKNKSSEATTFIGSKQRWLYAYASYLNQEVAKIKAGNSTRLQELEGKGLIYVDILLEKAVAREKLKVVTNTEIKTKNDSNPVVHKKIGQADLHMENLFRMFNSRNKYNTEKLPQYQTFEGRKAAMEAAYDNFLLFNFGADKNSLYAIKGLPSPMEGRSKLYNSESETLGEDFKKVLTNYVKGELARSKEGSDMVEEYLGIEDPNKKISYVMNHLIPGFHYKLEYDKDGLPIKDLTKDHLDAGDFKRAMYHKLGIFTSSFNKFLESNKREARLVYNTEQYGDVPIIRAEFMASNTPRYKGAFERLLEMVYSDVNDTVKAEAAELQKIVINRELLESEEGDTSFTEQYLFDVDNGLLGPQEQTLFPYIIGSFITSYELTNIFNGPVSYYSQKSNENINLKDFLKRATAVSSDGLYLYQNKKDNKTKTYYDYDGNAQTVLADRRTVVAVVQDMVVPASKFAQEITATRGGKTLTYSHEIADGQGWTTPGHFREVLTRTVGWDAHDQTMYDQLNDRNHVVSIDNIKWLTKYSKGNTPLKLTHFENSVKTDYKEENGKEGIPVYLKYSVAPLFPAIVGEKSDAAKLLAQMEKQGVDQLVYQSASKGANPTPTKIHNLKEDKSYDGLMDDIKLNPFTIDSYALKIQTIVPTKLTKSIAVVNQVIKNILVNFNMESTSLDYNFLGKSMTAKDMDQEINQTLNDILAYQLEGVLNKLGYDKNNKQFNVRNIKNFLKNQIKDSLEFDLEDFLDTDLPLETVPNLAQRIFPIISSYIAKNAGKVYTNGGSVVQVADTGFISEEQDTKGMYIFDENNKELTPPIPSKYKDLDDNQKLQLGDNVDPDAVIYFKDDKVSLTKKEGFKMRIQHAKIVLPFTDIFKKTGLSYNEFIELHKKGKVDMNIFKKGIGYRIPNQAIASIDAIDIVGIMPPLAGDQAIVYHEITAKTGSDFDIDKLYLMLPYFETDRVFAVPAAQEESIEKIKEIYPNVILNPQDYYEKGHPFSTRNGIQILNIFRENSPMLDEWVSTNYPHLELKKTKKSDMKLGHPIGILLENQNEVQSMLQVSNARVSFEDGSTDSLNSLFLDLLNAREDLQYDIEAVQEKKAELRDKISDIKKKYGYQKTTEINYVSPEGDGIQNKKNRLIESFLSVLESEATYDDLMSPLDSSEIKDEINAVLHEKALKQGKTTIKDVKEWIASLEETGLSQLFPNYLVNFRTSMLEAKQLIAMMANNMTDLGASQKVNFQLAQDIGLKVTSLSRQFEIGSKDPEKKISKRLSYMMNASVDVVKDPYLVKGNYSTYTGNTGILLTRLGIKLKDQFTIMTNETITKLSKEKLNATGKVTSISTEYSQSDLNEYTKSFVKELQKKGDVFKVISRKDFLMNNPDMKFKILGFWNLLQETSKEFNNSVVATKSDANGPGKNLSEMVGYMNRLHRMKEDTILNADLKLFKNGLSLDDMKFNPDIHDNPNATYLGTMLNNTLLLMNEVSSTLFLEGKDTVKAAINDMSARLGSPLPTNEGQIKLLYNYLYPYLLYTTNHSFYQLDGHHDYYGTTISEEEFLINYFPEVIQEYKDSLNNDFLNMLDLDTSGKEDLVKFMNSEVITPEDRLRFKEAISELVEMDRKNANNTKMPTIKKDFVKNLIKYSYLTTGFKPTPFSFHSYFPANVFIDNMHGKAVETYLTNNNLGIDSQEALVMLAKNNHNNFKIVTKLRKGDSVKNIKDPAQAGFLERITIDNGLTKSYTPFLKRKTKGGKIYLYMLQGTDSEGYPVYDFMDFNDISTFKTFNYLSLHQELSQAEADRSEKVVDSPQVVPYRSGVKQIFEDKSPIEVLESRASLDMKEEIVIEEILKEENLTREEWDSLPTHIKQNIKNCR